MKKLQRAFNRLGELKNQTEAMLGSLTDEQFNRVPSYGGWSAAQVLKHMIDVESAALTYMRKKSSGDAPLPSGKSMKERMGLLLLKLALVSPIKFKAPSVLPENTGPYTRAELRQEWEMLRSDLDGFIKNYPEALSGAKIFRHPQAGRFQLKDAIRFLGWHLRRHQKQMRRVLRNTAVK